MENTVHAEFAAALALQRSGDLARAETSYRVLIARNGTLPAAEHMLALVLHAQGRSEESLRWFERAENQGSGAVLWSNHAAALLATGRVREARQLCRRAIAAEPSHAGSWLNVGLACELEGNIDDAIAAFRTVLRLTPGNTAALRALARCQLRTGDAKGALNVLSTLPEGKDAAADLIRCEAWIDDRNFDLAAAAAQRLAGMAAVRVDALLLQAKIATEQGRREDALDLYRQVLEADPDNRTAAVRGALIHINRAETEIGLAQMRRWIAAHPDDHAAVSNYLVACDYSERFDPASLLAEHQKYKPLPPTGEDWPANWRPHSGKLRIGWVSTAFNLGPIEIFFADVFRAFAVVSPDVEHILYAIDAESRSAPTADAWAGNVRDLSRLGNADALAAIRADGLDIVVDLVGRASGNRLAIFAARAAPVQVGWHDQYYPSGVEAMDYLVTDPWLSPPGADVHFSEKLLRLPSGRLAYRPPPAEEPSKQGVASQRFVSLNRFSKIGDSVVAVWAEILRALPAWTLLLKASGGDDRDLPTLFRARFAAHGIAPERVEVEGSGTYAMAMHTYQNAAIALDPFPFTGCATTCDALWMGLPVITWPHETIASRQSASLLEAAGKPEWIAADADDYVAIAVRLALDDAARRDWRAQARQRLRPALCDARRLAQELIDALRAVAPRR
ncbi:MAG TPA: tetratricopeptide repeat protein [Rudaea sp.]|nr:tetratricopeptide repeat protein [Rudaea sp.]